jgi:hypothetical protein
LRPLSSSRVVCRISKRRNMRWWCDISTGRELPEGSGGGAGDCCLRDAGRLDGSGGSDGLVVGACWDGWQAHSARRESCNSDSSPEPSAACSERGLWGEERRDAASTLGLVGRAGRRTPCARESCNSDSSPEPSAACSEGGK